MKWSNDNYDDGGADGPKCPLDQKGLLSAWENSRGCPPAEAQAYRLAAVFCQLMGRLFPISKSEWDESSLDAIFEIGISELRRWPALAGILRLDELPDKAASVRTSYNRARARIDRPRADRPGVPAHDAGSQHWKV